MKVALKLLSQILRLSSLQQLECSGPFLVINFAGAVFVEQFEESLLNGFGIDAARSCAAPALD